MALSMTRPVSLSNKINVAQKVGYNGIELCIYEDKNIKNISEYSN